MSYRRAGESRLFYFLRIRLGTRGCYDHGIMRRQFRLIFAAIFPCLVAMTGCGPALFKDVSTEPQAEGGLAGNWLIGGTLPFTSNYVTAVTLDEFEKQISGSPSVSFFCQGASTDGVNTDLGAGTIGSSGAFTLYSATTTAGTPPVTYEGMTIQAVNSTDSPAFWQGTVSLAQVIPGCNLPLTETLTATRIAAFTGTYAGPITMFAKSSGVSIQPTIQISVQQGGIAPGTTQFSETVLNGSIVVQGSPCVTSGTMTANDPSYYGGDIATMSFAMNDGSTWSLLGSIDDIGATKVSLYSTTISGGSCNFTSIGPNAELLKQ